MKDHQIIVFLLALSVFRDCLCIEKYSTFRLSSTPARFAQTLTSIEGISRLECAVRAKTENVFGINYQAESRRCELIEKTGICVEYQAGDIAGWQAYRSCDAATEGIIWFFKTKIQFVPSVDLYSIKFDKHPYCTSTIPTYFGNIHQQSYYL